MTAQDQIKTLKNTPSFQVQVIPDDGAPYADTTASAKTDARRALAALVDAKLTEGYEFAEGGEPGMISLEKSTTVMAPVTTVERLQVRVLERSAWDVLSADESDALLVAAAREDPATADSFPVEWLSLEEQAAERDRRQPKPVDVTPVKALS